MRVAMLCCFLVAGCSPSSSRVVLYSAQDRDYGEPILADFQTQQKVSVESKWDSEANKAVGLAGELLAEKASPRADVHWNNEPLNTIRLARQGVYEFYRSSIVQSFPAWSTPVEGTWQGFASRARVLIVNTGLVSEDKWPKSIFDLAKPEWKGKVAMAKPLFGTTASQAACLFEVLGPQRAAKFYHDLRDNDVAIVAGNKNVAVDVAAGKYAVGFTDSDDAILEVLAKKPVAIVYPDREGHAAYPNLGVLFLPNTLALVRGGANPEAGKKLIDYLLNGETELRLAQGGGYQCPLNPALAERVRFPGGLLMPDKVTSMRISFEKAADQWDVAQTLMRELFAQ